jgi:hypothetical protein
VLECWEMRGSMLVPKEIWAALQEHFRPDSRFPIQEIARQSAKLPERRRGHPGACTVHGRALAGCPHVKSIHVPRRGRVLSHDALDWNTLPPSWSVFIAAWKVMPDFKDDSPTVIGHIPTFSISMHEPRPCRCAQCAGGGDGGAA